MWLTLWFSSYCYWGALNFNNERNKGDNGKTKGKTSHSLGPGIAQNLAILWS